MLNSAPVHSLRSARLQKPTWKRSSISFLFRSIAHALSSDCDECKGSIDRWISFFYHREIDILSERSWNVIALLHGRPINPGAFACSNFEKNRSNIQFLPQSSENVHLCLVNVLRYFYLEFLLGRQCKIKIPKLSTKEVASLFSMSPHITLQSIYSWLCSNNPIKTPWQHKFPNVSPTGLS